jgi:hypothetical protein
MSNLIAELPQSFLDEFEKEILGRVPDEKVKVQLKQEKLARVMRQTGSVQMEGLGQRIAVIDRRLFFRMEQAYGGHDGWITDMLKDNPELCAPGYRPHRKGDFRHGKTFVNGKPI